MRGTQILAQVFALIILGLLIALVLKWGVFFATSLSSEAAAAAITVFGSIVVAAWSFSNERAKARAEAHRAEKVKIYTRFTNLIFGFFVSHVPPHQVPSEFIRDPDAVQRALHELKRDLLLWCSPLVIQKFNDYFSNPPSADLTEAQLPEQAARLGQIILALREDIGLSNKGIEKHFFLKLMTKPDDFRRLKSLGLV